MTTESVSGAPPRHVAIIMDGNGRWAESRGLPRVAGHEEGANSVREVVRACREQGVGALTLYSFSTENWSRPVDEVLALMNLLERYLVEERGEILDNQIRFRAIGDIERLPQRIQALIEELSAASECDDPQMELCLALSYGGRAELVRAARSIAERVASGELKVEDIDEECFGGAIYAPDLGDVDLLIRTSGEMRISNFLLWQLAYAELYITDVAWPEFRRPQLALAFEEYGRRERRFGMTSQQLKEAF